MGSPITSIIPLSSSVSAPETSSFISFPFSIDISLIILGNLLKTWSIGTILIFIMPFWSSESVRSKSASIFSRLDTASSLPSLPLSSHTDWVIIDLPIINSPTRFIISSTLFASTRRVASWLAAVFLKPAPACSCT